MTTTEAFETLMPNPWAYISDGSEGKLQASRLQWSAQHQLVHSTAPVYSHAQMRAMFDAATELCAEQIARIRSVRNDSVEDMRSEIELLRDFHSFFKDRGEFLYAHFGMAPIDLYNKCGLNSAAIRAREDGVAG